jgi:outer membrane receptor protein involved in Fe transport
MMLLFGAMWVQASVFGTIRAIVHDPQHRPIANAKATVTSRTSAWVQTANTDDEGLVQFTTVPVGEYELTVDAPGFASQVQKVTAISDRVQELHLALAVATATENVEVSAEADTVNPTSSTSQTLISRSDIGQYAGTDRTNSLSFITNFTPGAYVVHDQLHVRGGHQVTWAVDGVPVPNTNIASNVGPQFDPKDVDYVEAQRGGLMADYGDRAYGVFNVVPRTGFERSREGEVLLNYGSFHSTDSQISFGDHTDRFAYYASLNGNRSDYGLETSSEQLFHDQVAGGGGFTTLIFNPDPHNQLRFTGSMRTDFYQVPNDADLQDAGVRDREREQDAFANFTWLHTFNASTVLSVTPFYHFNRAAFEGGANDLPSATDNRASNYGGGQVSLSIVRGRHNAKIGFYGFGQHDTTLFGLAANDGSGVALQQRDKENGDLEAGFIEDQFKATQWLTFNGGLRLTRFSGALNETAASPRVGTAVQLPKLHWVLRASYSRIYQAPPLSTVNGPLLDLASTQGFGFLPLHGERDEQHEFGIAIPMQGWTFDFAYFRTAARNFFDHDVLGNSNIFFPLTIDRARIRGFESTVKSPKLFGHVEAHLVYSHQTAQGEGAVTGGLTDFTPPDSGLFFLDHDQRNTVSTGFHTDLPWRSWFSANVSYGSGFLNGDGPAHLPSYATADLSIGKSFGENWSAKFDVTNVSNTRYFIDLSNTFGGSHVNDPRRMMVGVKYRFKY